MLELRLKVVKTELKVTSMPEPFTEGLKNYAKVVFEFGTDWDGLGKLATFKRVIDQHTVTVNVANNECIIPYEVFSYPQVEISVIGRSQEKTITSTVLRFDVKRNLGEGGSPQPETPDIFDQILEASQAAEDMANQVYQDAQAGKFNGTNGADGQDGETPTIGANGNWFVGDVDTGKPSRGEDGTDGVNGSDGADGKAATVKIGTVTTGEAGTQASVTNSGTDTDAVLDFVIPRGADGSGGGASGDYLPTTGGTLTGNVAVNTGTTEPNVTLTRTVDNAPCELTARIDSEAKAGLRYKVSGSTVNELILEQTKTRFRKPLDTASGGVPTDGTEGQVLTKNASGHAWSDLPDILDPQEIREMINAPVIEVQGETAKLKAPDETPVLLGIEGGGTGASTAADATINLKAWSLYNGEIILADSDLNDYVEPGNYYSPTSSTTSSLTNCPISGSGFILRVYSYVINGTSITVGNVTQELIMGDSRWIRAVSRQSTGAYTFGTWKHYALETDLANYLPLTGGTLTGHLDLGMNNTTDTAYKGFRSHRAYNGDAFYFELAMGSEGNGILQLLKNGTLVNRLMMYDYHTELYKPLTIASGGTGQTTAKGGQHALLSGMNSATDTPTDDSKLVFAYDASTANNGAVFKRPLSALWTWIKSKTDSIYAAVNHTHEISDVEGLQTALNGKSPSTHCHNADEIGGLAAEIKANVDINTVDIKHGTKTFNVTGEFATFDQTVSLNFDPTNYLILCSVLAPNATDPSQAPTVQGGGAYKKTTNSFSVAGYCSVAGNHKIEWVAIPLS